MSTLIAILIVAGILSGVFVLGSIFGASVYHFAKSKVEAGAQAVARAADKAEKAIDSAAAKV